MRVKLLIAAAFVLVLSLPFLVKKLAGAEHGPAALEAADGTIRNKLIVVTPHVEQIRLEFGAGFDRWHRRKYGEPATIDWRTPGGTSEIIKQLEAQFDAAARGGRIDADGRAASGTLGFDLFFGGGSFEHGKMRTVRKGPGGKPEYRMGQPAGFTKEQLEGWFGENKIGTQDLYDPEQYWIGTALSGFGIVYNKDVLKRLGLAEPRSFTDLCDPAYQNMLALADPRQSGSVTTTFESIMNKEGWDAGWKTLREMCANARYFASAATKVPVDVSQGEAAAGLAIDFYGRGQAQFTVAPGQDPATARVGYVDPEGAVYIDADPASILNGAPNAELAKRFIEYCLTDEAQALWQMPARSSPAGANNPKGEDGGGMGPDKYELRRMPVRRAMYEKYGQHFIDKANPFELASDVPGRGWRGSIAPLMAAFAIDVSQVQRRAWTALNNARVLAKAGRFSAESLASMEQAFYAMPEHRMKDGSSLPFNEANYKTIYADADKFKDTEHAKRTMIAYTEFFRRQYRAVIAAGPAELP
jgi:iron(III) transport system substrate-binding protein